MSIRTPLIRFQGRGDGGTLTPPSPAPPPASWRFPEGDGRWRRDAPSPPPTPDAEPTPAPAMAKPARLSSLDAFRGLTILGMLLVNNISLGAQTPRTLLHAEWSGAVHLADFVFPWFLFIVGVALPYSQASARRRHLSRWQYDLKALWRALTLVFLGCVIDSFLVGRWAFGLGVLQVIGLAYFVAVLLGGPLPLRGRMLAAAGLLAGHWALLKFAPHPGGAGTFTESANVVRHWNETYLAPLHLKGLLSVVPTTAMVLIGTAVGDLLRRKKLGPAAKAGRLVAGGAALAAAGWAISHALPASLALPMNKPTWTAPYILYTAGWACAGLAAMYLLVDATPGKGGRRLVLPLTVFGANAIVAYVAPILTKVAVLRNVVSDWPTPGKFLDLETGLREWFYAHAGGRLDGGWAYTAAYIGLWWCVLLVLYRKRWFLRV